MTRKEIQKEIAKQFKRRLRRTYGNWRTLWDLDVVTYDSRCAVDLMSLVFRSDFTVIEIIFDNCLNTSIRISGEPESTFCLRPFLDVCDEIRHYIAYLFADATMHSVLWSNIKSEK